MIEKKEPLTVGQIREALAGLSDDAVPTWTSWDSEALWTGRYGIAAINPEGRITSTLIDGWHDWDEDDEEIEAEIETAEAESAATLYHDDSPRY